MARPGSEIKDTMTSVVQAKTPTMMVKRMSTHEMSSSGSEDEADAPNVVVTPSNGPSNLHSAINQKEIQSSNVSVQNDSMKISKETDVVILKKDMEHVTSDASRQIGSDLPPPKTADVSNSKSLLNKEEMEKEPLAKSVVDKGSISQVEITDDDDLQELLGEEFDASDIEDDDEPTVLSSGESDNDIAFVGSDPPKISTHEISSGDEESATVLWTSNIEATSAVPDLAPKQDTASLNISDDEGLTFEVKGSVPGAGDMTETKSCEATQSTTKPKKKAGVKRKKAESETGDGVEKKVPKKRKKKGDNASQVGDEPAGEGEAPKKPKRVRKKKPKAEEGADGSTAGEAGATEAGDASEKPKKKPRKKKTPAGDGEEVKEGEGEGDAPKPKKKRVRKKKKVPTATLR